MEDINALKKRLGFKPNYKDCLKTLEQTTWEEIGVGEVFAEEEWVIWCKLSDKDAFYIESSFVDCYGVDCIDYQSKDRVLSINHDITKIEPASNKVYRLPKSVQSLWLT